MLLCLCFLFLDPLSLSCSLIERILALVRIALLVLNPVELLLFLADDFNDGDPGREVLDVDLVFILKVGLLGDELLDVAANVGKHVFFLVLLGLLYLFPIEIDIEF